MRVGATWTIEPVDGEMVSGPSLALDSFGNPHFAYCDVRPPPPTGPGAGLKYAYHIGSDWVIGSVEKVECQYPSLVLDTSGNPHISYYDVTNEVLKYARWATTRRVYLPVILRNY